MDACREAAPAPDPHSPYRRVLWLVLAINAAMFGVEVVFGLIAGSLSLQADALDFLGDALSYGISLAVLGRAVHWRAGASLLEGAAMATFFTATQIIGSVRTSLLMNFEAVSAILLGYLILGQTLTPMQLIGAAIVIAALFVARRRTV